MTKIISVCLIIRNEEKCLERCLKSLDGAVNEIIVVHDGECNDQSMEIAREYGAKTFIRPERGFMEAHLPFAVNQAQGEWVLRIDADEFLSQNLGKNLRILTRREEADAYEFIWPIWNGKKYTTIAWPRKTCFFRKKAIRFLGIPHAGIEVSGKIIKTKLVLNHQPGYDNLSYRIFKTKWKSWAKRQAEYYLKNISEIEKFGEWENSWPMKIKLRKKFPLLIALPDALIALVKVLAGGAAREGLTGWKAAVFHAAYRVTVNYHLFILKEKNK